MLLLLFRNVGFCWENNQHIDQRARISNRGFSYCSNITKIILLFCHLLCSFGFCSTLLFRSIAWSQLLKCVCKKNSIQKKTENEKVWLKHKTPTIMFAIVKTHPFAIPITLSSCLLICIYVLPPFRSLIKHISINVICVFLFFISLYFHFWNEAITNHIIYLLYKYVGNHDTPFECYSFYICISGWMHHTLPLFNFILVCVWFYIYTSAIYLCSAHCHFTMLNDALLCECVTSEILEKQTESFVLGQVVFPFWFLSFLSRTYNLSPPPPRGV